jgi:hypothetical protein
MRRRCWPRCRHLNEVTLEAVLIGNAADALQGPPVTTVDFDCLVRSIRAREEADLEKDAPGRRRQRK